MAAIFHHPTTATIASPAAAFSHCSSPSSLLQCSQHFHHYPSKPTSQPQTFVSPVSSLAVSKFKPPVFLPNPPPSTGNSPPISKAEPFSDPLLPRCSSPRSVNYQNLLKLSVKYNDLELIRAIHASSLKLDEDIKVSNALITAYLKLGFPNYASKVFYSLARPDVVSYTAIISGFAKLDREVDAIELFCGMRDSGIEPNEYTFVAILTACNRLLDSELGFQIHAILCKLGILDCTYVVNALIGLYSKCDLQDSVSELFSQLTQRDIASWNTIISGMVKESMYDQACETFRDMLRIDDLRADSITLSTLLAASSGSFATRVGRELHAHALKIGYESNLSVNNALLGFYTKCGSLKDVVALFERMPIKDVFTWTHMITAYMEFGYVDSAVEIFDSMQERNCITYNALLAGYCQNGKGLKALDLFCRMLEERLELTDFTLTSVINACALIMDLDTSEQIHGFVLKFGYRSNKHIEAALVDMYARCGRMADANLIFNHWPFSQDFPIIFTSMICGFARNGQPEEAISFFISKQSEHSEELNIWDEDTLAAMLGICGTLGHLRFGEQIHCCTCKYGLFNDTGVGNALISMYSKCDEMENAVRIFDVMHEHDIVSWNCLLTSYILHRNGDAALAAWYEMEKQGVQPDSLTCLFIISAYRYTSSNLIDNCRRFFYSLGPNCYIKPSAEHYSSFISVLGHWGLLEEAEKVINKMPFKPTASVWRALLASCRIHLNADIGKRAAKEILSLDPQDPATFILKSNIYSASGRWHCSEVLREEMRDKGFHKLPGRSWLIYDNKMHSFYARDKSHFQSKDILSGLQILIIESLKAGYVPDTSFVLHDVEEHQKKDFLFHHSAKLAVTYGLLMIRPGKPVRVMKNILLCGDCHTFFKYVSVVTKRDIHVRDTSGFHIFRNGKCSCKDFW